MEKDLPDAARKLFKRDRGTGTFSRQFLEVAITNNQLKEEYTMAKVNVVKMVDETK